MLCICMNRQIWHFDASLCTVIRFVLYTPELKLLKLGFATKSKMLQLQKSSWRSKIFSQKTTKKFVTKIYFFSVFAKFTFIVMRQSWFIYNTKLVKTSFKMAVIFMFKCHHFLQYSILKPQWVLLSTHIQSGNIHSIILDVHAVIQNKAELNVRCHTNI